MYRQGLELHNKVFICSITQYQIALMLNFSMEHFKALTPPPLSNPHQIYGDEVKQGEKKIGWLTLHYLKKIKSLVSKNSTYSEVSYGKFETLNVFFDVQVINN